MPSTQPSSFAPARAHGRHLFAANDPATHPALARLYAAIAAEACARKGADWHERNDRRAFELQVQRGQR